MNNIIRSHSVRDKTKKFRNLDFSISSYQKNAIKEEMESSREYLSDTQEEINNDDDSDNIKPVSKFQYYFETIITIILCFHCYFIYSYLNIFHLVFCFLFTYSKYDIEYNFLVKNKKTLIMVLIIIDSVYLIVKSIFFIILSLENGVSQSVDAVNPFFIVKYEWRNYYEYVMIFCVIVLLIANLIIGEFDYSFWKYSILPKNYQILEKHKNNNNTILNFGVFYISLGAALYPNATNLAILSMGFLFFLSLLLKKYFRIVMKKYVSLIMIFVLPTYTITNYLLNSEEIMDKINSKATKIIFVHLFNTIKNKEESEYLIGTIVYIGFFPFLFYIKGFNEINFYLKCFKYLENKKVYKDNDINLKKIRNSSRKKNDTLISSFNGEDNSNGFNKNEMIFSLKEPINDEQSKRKLQGIFNENIDCGIIIFTEEASNFDFFTKIKMFLFKFCYTPAFILHICRLGVILWVYCYITYPSIILIIWLFISIQYSKEKFFFIITKFIIFPLLILIFIISYISNIKGSSFDSEFFGLIYYTSSSKRFFNMGNQFLIITFFQIYIHLKTKHINLLKDFEFMKEINKQKEEIENVIDQEFKGEYVTKPLEMFFKLYFAILDIALIIFSYFSFTQTINILNQIGLLVLISGIILNSHNFKSKGVYICLIVSNISFLAKYIVHFIYPKMKNINNISKPELILIVLFHDRLYNIHYYWITYYFLFLEYISQKSRLFQICEKKTISINKIIELYLGSHNYIKILLSTIINFLFGIYIWLLIPVFVACLLMQDNNFIFFAQFIIIFIIYYKYIKIVNNNFSDFDQITNIFNYTWPLIFSTIINLTLIYFFQFLNKRPLSVFYSLFSFKTKKILEVMGLFVFNGDYSRELLCFFIMFITSIALHAEIGRQIQLNAKSVLIKKTVTKYALSYYTDQSNEDRMFENLSKLGTNKDDIKEKFDIKDSNNNVESKKEREKFKKKLIKRKIEKQRATQMIYRLYMALYYILHYYWILIFILIAAMAIHWMLSISMTIQISLFCFYVGKSFIVYYKFFKNQNMNKEANQTIKEKINIYATEKLDRFKTTLDTQQEYFRYLWSFTFSFIVLSYLCSIILKIIQAFSVGYLNNLEGIKLYKEFSSVMYVLGFYSVNGNESNNRTFFAYSWGYFTIIGLFSIRAYLSGIFLELKTVYFNRKRNYMDKKYNKMNTENYIRIVMKSNKLDNANRDKGDDNITKELKDFNEPAMLKKEKIKYNFKNTKKVKIKRKSSFENNNLDIFKKEKKEFTKENKLFYYSRCDFEINYRDYFKIKDVGSNFTLQKGIKKFLELLIVILIAFDAMLKCNVISFILIFILVFLYSVDSLKTQVMFKLSFFILIIFVLQYLIFVTNISYYTNPFINEEVTNYITETLKLPWYVKIGYRWATFFSFGTNRYQIISLWLEISIILILYFYLEFFSFSIYLKDDSNKNTDKIMSKFNKKFQELQTMNKNEYKSFVRAMKVSYDIELKSNVQISEKKKKNAEPIYNRKLLEILYYFKKDNRFLYLVKSDKVKTFLKIKSFFYLSFHYFLLLLILLISLINQGLIVLGYMSFSIFYLYKSHCFLKGRRWTLLNGIHCFMKPYLFFDILTQFIFQIPLNIFSKNYSTLNNFFKIFGYVKIVDYSSKEEFLDKTSFVNIFLKILTYFLILIQENVYVSYDFKKFILRYHYEYLQKAFIKGKLYSFLFNNSRVHMMNDRLKQRKEINETLNNILCTITDWNKHLRNFNIGNNVIADLYKAIPQKINELKKEESITIGNIVRKQWLISLALKMYESSFTIEDEHYNVSCDILKILKGSTVLNSYLDDLIDEYEKKYYEKYKDIKNIKLINEEKRKKKEEEEKKKEEEKNKKKKNGNKNANSNTKPEKKYKLSLIEENHITNKRGSMNLKSPFASFRKKNKKLDSGSSKNESLFNVMKNIDENNEIYNYGDSEDEKNEDKDEYLNNGNDENNNENKKNNRDNYKIKLDQPYDDMFFGHMDYKEFKEEIRQDFFLNYISKKKIFLDILKSFFNFFLDNFEYTVFLLMILNHLIYGTASSLVFAFLVFILGIIQYPRPSKLFWKISLIYCTIIIFLKFILQLNVWNDFQKFQDLINIQKNPLGTFAIIGIYKLGTYKILKFFYYVIFDFLILIALIMNQFILIRKGLWYMTEIDYESILESNDRIIRYNNGKLAEKNGLSLNPQKILTSNEIIEIIGKVLPPKKGNFKKVIQGFYNKNFSHIRNEKPGKDFYIEYTLFQILILIYIIFLYTFMEKDQEIYNVNILQLKQFSGHMAIFLFIHIFFIVFDRIIYLKNTRKLKKIEFKIYNKLTGDDITGKYKKYTYLDVLTKLNSHNYEIVTFQYEGCQTGLLMKFANQIITFIFIHLFIFFYLPYYGVVDEKEELNTLGNNIFILLFYLLYIFYFIFSGFQIKYGLSDLRKMSGLMKSSDLFHNYFYKVFKAVPFLFELKNFVDWTFTTTSLDLWKWLKLEEIISLLYINKCFTKSNMYRRVGTKMPLYTKILLGGSIFFGVLLIVFGPIFLFSSLNPTNEVKPVIGVNLKVILQIPPIDKENQQKYELTLMDLHNSEIKIFSSDSEYNSYIKKEEKNVKRYISAFKYQQVQRVKIFGYSETNWDISPKLLDYFKDNINEQTLNISLKYSFTSSNDPNSGSYYGNDVYEDINNDIFEKIYDLIFNPKSNDTELEIRMPEVFSPYQKLQTDKEPTVLFNKKVDAILVLSRQFNGEKSYFNWNIYSKYSKDRSDVNTGIEFITFSDFYSSFTFGMDVITFYVSFVVVVGNVIRVLFLGQSERIMYTEMVNPGKLLSVCEGIKISRIKKDFLQEEKLYYLLIDFMRSPEMFKNITLSSLIYIQDNNIGREEIKYKEYEVESVALYKDKKNNKKNSMIIK